MKRCGFILLCALVVSCVLLAGCGGKTAERSEAGEVFAFCGGEAENFAKTFDVNEMNCILYNLNGYYDGLKALLGHMIEMGLSTKERQEGIYFADTLDEIERILAEK